MQLWPIPARAGVARPSDKCEGKCSATEALIDCIARAGFGARALTALNHRLPVAWWTVYQVFDDQAPRLRAQASHAVPDVTLDCWRIYQAGVYREDTHFMRARDAVRRGDSAHAVMTHCLAEDFGRAHREQIYQAHSLSERLSLVSAADDAESLLAINLYRHRAQDRFNVDEIDAVFALAAPLLAVVRRHLEITAEAAPAERMDGLGTSMGHLRRRCPQLTPREFEVCDRLLRGWTHDGIAADLGLSPTTVKTYRNRAFERLGIHHRNELFKLALDGTPGVGYAATRRAG